MYKSKDTIFAVSTPSGKAAIAVIRISGKDAFNIVNEISSNMPSKPNLATLNKIISKGNNEIDQTITTIFKAPRSYTGEDMVEITLHGSSAVLKKTLELLGKFNKSRLALPGEFTRRAFENNKLDLTQIEAVIDLINSETEAQRKQAISQLRGKISKEIKLLSDSILKILASVEAAIDFSDEDLPDNLIKKSKEQIRNIYLKIGKMLNDNNFGERIRDGFNIAIIGKTNVGKSSFINNVAKREIAIVTEEPGTTRDIIESFIDFRGYPIKIFDTAGIRKTNNKVEKIGINKSYETAKNADVNLVFIDNIEETKNYPSINNKIFVQSKTDIFPKIVSNKKISHISSATGKGIDNLFNKIYEKILITGKIENSIVSRERHRQALNKTAEHLNNSLKIKSIDLFAEDIRLALKEISKITGNKDIEDILEIIFSDFCIGK